MDIKHLATLAAACVASLLPLSQATATSEAKAPLPVAFVYVSPAADTGWTAQHNAGRKQLQNTLASAVKTQYVENVAEGADAERVIRDLATIGNKLIITTSFGYMEPTLKVAKEFPNTKFIHVSGYKTAPNVATVNARFYEGRYLAGYLAGASSKTGQLGYVAAIPIPEVLQGINAYTLGARAANPKAQIHVLWTGTWFDPNKDTDASKTLLAHNVDVFTHHTEGPAVALTAEAAGKKFLAYHSDMRHFAPKGQLAAVTHHWGNYDIEAAKQVMNGTWKSSDVWGGIAQGMIKLDFVANTIPKAVRSRLSQLEQGIKSGKTPVFQGQIKDNTGKQQHSGGAMSDAQLHQMNYLVEGVVGQLPK